MPDLVAEPQVGLASGLVGMMQIVGNVTGFVLVSLAVELRRHGAGPVAVAIVELVTMGASPCASARGCRRGREKAAPGRRIAREAWATDILQGAVLRVAARLAAAFLTGGALLANFVVIYLRRTFGMSKAAANGMNVAILLVVVVANVIAIIPASRLSDRLGRKPLI